MVKVLSGAFARGKSTGGSKPPPYGVGEGFLKMMTLPPWEATVSYNTPKRSHIVKTRLDDEEYSEFLRRMELYGFLTTAKLSASAKAEQQQGLGRALPNKIP